MSGFFGPRSQSLAVKDVCFVHRGISGGLLLKLLAATLPGN